MIAIALGLVLLAQTIDRPIDDRADVIPADVEAQLTAALEKARDDGTCDLRVLTVNSLDGRPIEEVGLEVAAQSGIGSKERDDGVLLLIAVEDREMRIETGRGVEATLTDAHCFEITRRILRPKFREGAYGEGVREAVSAILAVVGGEAIELPSLETPDEAGATDPEGETNATVSVRLPGWRWWLAVLAAVGIAFVLRGFGVAHEWSWLALGAAFPLLPAVHLLGSDRATDLGAGLCFALAALLWFSNSKRTPTLRERAGAGLEALFARPWTRPLGHALAFPWWLLRVAFRQPYRYGYWVDIRGYRWRNEHPERWSTIAWWMAFAGFLLAAVGTGASGLPLALGVLLVALPLFGLVRGLAALIAAGFAGRLVSTGRGSSSSGSRWEDDTYRDTGESSSSPSSGGSFDGGGASDDW